MASTPNDNIRVLAPKDIDDKKGRFVSGAWRPYLSVAEANQYNVAAYRYRFQELQIKAASDPVPTTYWYQDNTTDAGLVPKPGGGNEPATFDQVPTSGSSNAVNSNGIFLSDEAIRNRVSSLEGAVNGFPVPVAPEGARVITKPNITFDGGNIQVDNGGEYEFTINGTLTNRKPAATAFGIETPPATGTRRMIHLYVYPTGVYQISEGNDSPSNLTPPPAIPGAMYVDFVVIEQTGVATTVNLNSIDKRIKTLEENTGDTALSPTSENWVQNKVVHQALANIESGGFPGFTEERFTSTPYTTTRPTIYLYVWGVYWNTAKQRKPNADNTDAPDYAITINANGTATISCNPQVSGGAGEIIYVATGEAVEPPTDTTPPSAPQNIVISNITTSGYTATANPSTDS